MDMNLLDLIAGLKNMQAAQPASMLNPAMPDQMRGMNAVDGDFIRGQEAMGNNPGGARNFEITPDQMFDLQVPNRSQPDAIMDPIDRMSREAPTEFSARARAPEPLAGPVRMPRPRPVEAGPGDVMDPATMSAMREFAPSDAERMATGRAPIPTGDSGKTGLLSLIAPDLAPSAATRGRIEAALGGGLSSVTGNTAGGNFARGMGGGLKASSKFDSDEFERTIKALKALQEAKTSGSNEEYKTALTGYYKTLAQQKNAASAKAAAPVQTASAAPGKPAATTPEISMKGDGTQGAPYAPNSKTDYDEIASGSYYIHPSTGQLRLKK